MEQTEYDAVIIGAGAAGLMAAVFAGRRGKKILLLERNEQAGKKILISGGGRCNYTNLNTSGEKFISKSPNFCKSVLNQWKVQDTISFFKAYGIHPTEKHLGQLFPEAGKARDFRDGLLQEALHYGVEIRYGARVKEVRKSEDLFSIFGLDDKLSAKKLVVVTGGASIPAMGSTVFALELAKSFGLNLVQDKPGLVPFTGDENFLASFGNLSGLSAEVDISTNSKTFREDILFTHKGISGPGSLQVSSYWEKGESVRIDFLPETNFQELKENQPAATIKSVLSAKLPTRLTEHFLNKFPFATLPFREISRKQIHVIEEDLHRMKFIPSGTQGYEKAEVMVGGIDTKCMDGKTLEVKTIPGLYFGGEALDVTGWLGGYNFQWAWACGYVIGNQL